MFRRHQQEMLELCKCIKLGTKQYTSLLVSVNPGGGKSLLPVIAASQLIPARADAICWIVPRLSLQEQAEQAFLDRRFRALLNHQHEIRQSTNDQNPCRGLSGYVTTYQAIENDSAGINRTELSRRRYILVLDEPQHVEEGRSWHRALQPLVDQATFVIYMSGTLERGNRRRIAFLPYVDAETGSCVDLQPTAERAVIRYSRQDALREQAIIPAYFRHIDGRAEWVDIDGDNQHVESFEEAGDDLGHALYTAVSTHYAFQLLDQAATDWQAYQRTHPRSKLLIVAPSIDHAKRFVEHLQVRAIPCQIATSDDSQDALQAIRAFKRDGRKGGLDVLVTVQMAYEGLDVPQITHVACLTHIRSRPWIEQMFARATRYDAGAGLWSTQGAYMYVPDDPWMRNIIQEITEEQQGIVREPHQEGGGGGGAWNPIVPLASDATRERASELASGDQMDYQETAYFKTHMERHGICGVHPLQIKRLLVDMGLAALPNDLPYVTSEEPLTTTSEKEANLLRSIEKYCRAVDHTTFDRVWGRTNKEIFRRWKKSRKDMSLQELMVVWQWLHEQYPLESTRGEP